MHWYDWMTLGILVVVTITQTVRGSKAGGMGLPLFEAGGLIVAAVAATAFAGPLASMAHMRGGVTLMVLFTGMGVLAIILARWLFTITGLSFQSLDGFFSFIFGLVAAWTIAHMVLRIVMESQGVNGEIATQIANAPVAREIFQFRTWNRIMGLLFNAKLGPEINPDVG
jgi:uncharacterized membrane protein YhhN